MKRSFLHPFILREVIMDWNIEFLQNLIKFFTFEKIITILGLI